MSDHSGDLRKAVVDARAAWHKAHTSGDPDAIAAASLMLRQAKSAQMKHYSEKAGQ